MRLSPCLLVSFVCATGLSAQSAVQHHIAAGDSAGQMHPDVALVHYQAALAADSLSYEANWRAARAIGDVAKQIQGNADSLKRRRDSLYTVGRSYAERAVRADSTKADGHYVLAMVLGRQSRTKGSKERVRYAKMIFDEATRAVQINPDHHNAHHVLGAWNAEVKRLSGFQRFFAKALFGGGFMSKASWDDAVQHLERAVAIAPQHIYHRLELAEVYADVGENS
jgi:tetratricopeptide (TPR) repeat protein